MTSSSPVPPEEEISPVGAEVAGNGRPDSEMLGARVRSGLSWKATSQLTGLLSRTATTIILAHLLAPRDFGLAGMVLVFSGLTLLLSDLGFSASLIQFDSLTEEDRSTAFWTGVLVALACVLATFLVAPYVADFYGEPRVRWMLVAVSAGFLTGALNTTQASLLMRKMEFRALEIRGIASSLVSAVAGITAAILGLGAWSLIIQMLAMGAVSTLAIWVLSPWKPSLRFSTASLRRLGGYSANVFVARVLYYLDRNVDNLLIGRFLGTRALGIYTIGYSVIIVPFERLIGPLQNVLIPAFASLQNDLAQMRRLWFRGVRVTVTLIFPAMVGVIIVAPDAVTVILGDRWMHATNVIRILAWVALVQSLGYLNGSVYQTRFRTGLLLRVTTLGVGLDLASFAIGLHWGIIGVAAAYAIANTVVLMPANLFLTTRLLDIRVPEVARELRGVIEATLVMAGVAFCVKRLLLSEGAGPTVRLVVVIVVGLLAYVLMCLWRDRRIFNEFRPQRLRTIAA